MGTRDASDGLCRVPDRFEGGICSARNYVRPFVSGSSPFEAGALTF